MAQDKLDLAQKFVNATIGARKETTQIEELTASILAKYQTMPGVLGKIGKLFLTRIENLTQENKMVKENQVKVRELVAAQMSISGLYDAQLKKMKEIQALLNKPNLPASQERELVQQLNMADFRAKGLRSELSKVNSELEFTRKVAGPAAIAMDSVLKIQNQINANVGFTMLGKALGVSYEINKSLRDANSEFGERNQLMNAGLRVAMQTGVSMRTLTQAQEELVSLGFDMKSNFEDTLKTTVQLMDGLGLSADAAGNLAVTAKTTNLAYKDLANVVSGIVDKTSLAANEAARYAREIAVAAKTAGGPGGKFDSSAYTKNLQTVAQLEGAMKGTIAVQGDVAAMLTKFTSFQQSGGMGLFFGTGGTDFLSKDQDAAKRVMLNIARAVKDSNGIMLEAQASMLNTNKETLSALGEMYRQQGASMFEIPPEMKERQDFEQRYRDQMALQGESFRMLSDKLLYLGGQVLTPLVKIVNTAAEGLIWVTQKFNDMKFVAVPAMILASTIVASSIISLTRSMYQFAASTVAVTAALNFKLNGVGKGGMGGAVASSAAGGVFEGLGSMLSSRLKKGAIAEGVEAVGGTAVKGLIGRIFGGLAGAFTGTMMRGLLGRGIALVGSAFLTGGWSIIIGLVVTLVAQFWPNLVNLFKGKGWSGDAGLKKPVGEAGFQQLIDKRAEKLAEDVAKNDRSDIKKQLQWIKETSTDKSFGATADSVDQLRDAIAMASERNVIAFAGQAQRRQGIDPATDVKNRETYLQMLQSMEELNQTMSRYAADFRESERDKARRESIAKEEDTRRRAADSGSANLTKAIGISRSQIY